MLDRLPNRSSLGPARSQNRFELGGAKSAARWRSRSKRCFVSWLSSCPAEYGRPYPNGVASRRAQSPARFGTMNNARPPGASTRQHSSRSIEGCSLVSSPCMRTTRSAKPVGIGHCTSDASTETFGPSSGQVVTPCCSGIRLTTLAHWDANESNTGTAKPNPTRERPSRSGQSADARSESARAAYRPSWVWK